MMGIGHTLFEHMLYQDGQLLNPGLIDYRIPAMQACWNTAQRLARSVTCGDLLCNLLALHITP
jgi:hypothetical protein